MCDWSFYGAVDDDTEVWVTGTHIGYKSNVCLTVGVWSCDLLVLWFLCDIFCCVHVVLSFVFRSPNTKRYVVVFPCSVLKLFCVFVICMMCVRCVALCLTCLLWLHVVHFRARANMSGDCFCDVEEKWQRLRQSASILVQRTRAWQCSSMEKWKSLPTIRAIAPLRVTWLSPTPKDWSAMLPRIRYFL